MNKHVIIHPRSASVSLSVLKALSQIVKHGAISFHSVQTVTLRMSSLLLIISLSSRMEAKPEDEAMRRRRRAARPSKAVMVVGQARPRPTLPTATVVAVARPLGSEVKLAAVAVDLNVRLRSADMPVVMQERAFRCTRALLDANPDEKRPNPTLLAMSLKKEFDALYGPAWHCIVGKSFGSFVTHSSGGFVYYSVEKLSFLLFKTQVRPVNSRQVR